MFQWHNKTQPILQLGADFYDPVKAADFPQQKLRYANPEIEITFPQEHLVRFHPLENNLPTPLALRYHGHQFQNYNPDLGDGRGFLFAQLQKGSLWYDLGTKGSGQTPYSRAGDGRLTLKGAVREALATEMLETLGVRTSRTLAFFETGEKLERHDEPSPTRSAVLTRYSLGHIRIGTFQRLAFFNQSENLHRLTSYCLHYYYPEVSQSLDHNDYPQLCKAFLESVTNRCADLVAQVMMAGFVHGVLNTDNINISGELFDYGPYRFLPYYDPQFTAAYFDHQGLYCYGRQPAAFLWSLHQLGLSLRMAHPSFEFQSVLEKFSEKFTHSVQKYFLRRLNIKSKSTTEDSQLLAAYFQMLQEKSIGFEQCFHDFHSLRALQDSKLLSKYEKCGRNFIQLLENYEIENLDLAQKTISRSDEVCSLLIDEIESIWKPIAENDDWSLFNQKIQQIRLNRSR